MHKIKKVLEWVLIIFIATSALILSLLLSYQQVYAGKVYRNVYFGAINLSGLSKKEASSLLENKFKDIENQQLTITCGDKEIKATLKDTGLSFSSQDLIDKVYNAGRGNNFWSSLKRSSSTLLRKTVIIGTPAVDQKALDNFIEIAVKQLNVDPIDAKLTIENGQIIEVKSQDGQIADTSNLIDKVIETASGKLATIELVSAVKKASIQSSDFAKAKQDAENLLNKKITLSYQGKVYQPSKQEIGRWIVFANNNAQYVTNLDDSNIKAYLNSIANNFEITKIDTKVDSETGTILSQGRDGVYLDKDQALNSLKSQIGSDKLQIELNVKNQSSNIIRVAVSQGVELGRYSGKYIDVNLTTQMLCRVDSQTLIDCYQASTGKPSTPTPTGSYTIGHKNTMGWAPNPGVWMPWFMEFKAGGYGFHELVVWPDGTHEVIDHLGQAVSHGCVRTAPGVAEMLFNWADVGTSVYIHK